MIVSILLPTLGERVEELKRLFDSLENQTNKSFELIIVTQLNHEKVESMLYNYTFVYKQIKIDRKGLSHARNIGMKYVKGNILSLSDDDAWYPENAIEKIINYSKKIKEEVLCFQIYDPLSKSLYKNYSKHKQIVKKREILRKSSIEICINLDKVCLNQVSFNENFGLGTLNNSGEENLLLYNLFLLGKKIVFINETVIFHQKKVPSDIDETFIDSKSEVLKIILGNIKGYFFINLILLKNFNKISSINKGTMFLYAFKKFF